MTEYRVGFSRKKHILARTIRAVTASEASHVYLRRIDGDSDLVLEAVGFHGVSLRPYSVFLDHGAIVLAEYLLPGPAEDLARAWTETCDTYLDRRYGWGQLVGDLYCEGVEAAGDALHAVRLRRRRGKRPRNPLASRALVCSELVLRYLRRAGMAERLGLTGYDPETVTPEDLWGPVERGCRRML